MAQPFNRVNATAGDYRGAKAVLGERVIEGLENYGDLISDLQLTYDTPKNVLIETVNNFRVILPKATDLIKGWTVFIINEDPTSNLTVVKYNSLEEKSIFNEIESTKMIQCMLVDNSTEEGDWRLLTTGELGITELEKKYTTSVYEKNIVSYGELPQGVTYIKELTNIPATTPIKSIFVKPIEKFDGVDVYLKIGTEEEPEKFIDDLKISEQVADDNYKKDLFEEILSSEQDKKVFATLYTKMSSGDSWVSSNYKNYNYVNSFYNNGVYHFITDEKTIVSTANLRDYEEISIASFDFDSEAILYENDNYYIACKKDEKFTIARTSDFKKFDFFETSQDIDSLPKCLIKTEENYIVVLDQYIFSTKYIENNQSWTFVKSEDLVNINKVACSSNLCVISCNELYFTTEDGVSLTRFLNDGSLYDYLDNKWINYYLHDEDSSVIRYSLDFSKWSDRDIQTVNILDIKFLNNTWFVITDYAQYGGFNLTTSRDFFTTFFRSDTKFETNNINTLCGLPNKMVVLGEEGHISYSTGEDFFALSSGKVEIVVEKVKEINPQTIKNPIINTQVPLGSIFNYPFSDIPNGYFRLDGGTIPNARVVCPDFVKKIEETFAAGYKNIFISNEQYNKLTDEEKNNCGAFSWTDDRHQTELRLPKINCFIRGAGDLQTIKDLVGNYQTDTIRSFQGTFTSFDRGDRGSYTDLFKVTERWSANVRSGDSDDWGTRVNLNTSMLGEHFSGSETQPKHVMYPYIISVYNAVQQIAELDLQSISDILKKNQEILQKGYEQLTRIQGEKSNIARQCVTIAPNTNYVRHQNGLSVVCDANVFGTNAQGFVNGIPFDIAIQTVSSLSLTLPANSSGFICLVKDITTNNVFLDYVTKWVVASKRPTLQYGQVWYDTTNEKLYIYSNGNFVPFYAVKIAEFSTSTTSIAKLKIEPFRRKSTYDCSIDITKGTTKSKETEYIADEAGLLYINIWEYNSEDVLYLNDEEFTRFRANSSQHNNGSTSEIMIPIKIGDKYILKRDGTSYKGEGTIWKYIFYPYVGETI